MPLILVQELDKGRGGASLEELQAECPDDLRGDVFFGQESTPHLRAMRVHAHALAPAHEQRARTQSTGWGVQGALPLGSSRNPMPKQEGAVVPWLRPRRMRDVSVVMIAEVRVRVRVRVGVRARARARAREH